VPRFSAVLPLIVAAVLGGAVGGFVVSQLAAPRAGPNVMPEPPVKSATTHDAPLETRMLALEEKVARLSRRPPGVALPAPTGAGPHDAGTGGPAPVIDDPVFEVAVRDIVDRVEEERSSARDVRRDEQRRRMSETWVADLGLELSLTEAQKSKVTEIVTEMFERLRDLRNLDAGTVRRSERVARMRAVSEDAEKKLAGVLDQTQLTAYRALDDDLRLTGRFGSRR
jgi:hypothetical protein